MKLFTLSMLTIVALAATPTSLADQVCAGGASEQACFSEFHSANGTCTDGYQSGTSSLTYGGAVGGAHVNGMSYCSGMSRYAFTEQFGWIVVGVNTELGYVTLIWSEHTIDYGGSQSRTCNMDINSSLTGPVGGRGCPAGGPPSGIPWGQLLP